MQGAFDNGDRLMDMLHSAAQDSSSGVNVLACEALMQLATGHGPALCAVSKHLVASVMPLLTHRLQKACSMA